MEHSNFQISLKPATNADDFKCIENMMQFYNYDFSEWYPINLNSNGLFSLKSKISYWQQKNVKPFIIFANEAIIGFVVVDDEIVNSATNFNMGYFFISRHYRGKGLGLSVAQLIFKNFIGNWEIYYISQNIAAAQFWKKTINILGFKSVLEKKIIDEEHCELYRFSTLE